jgi:hypothetical protein
LSRDQRIDAAMKILGDGVQRSDVEAVLDRMSKELEKWKRIRSLDSGAVKAFAKQYHNALRKVIDLTKKTPLGFGAPAWALTVTAQPLGINCEQFDGEHLLQHLGWLLWMCQYWDNSRLTQKKPKAHADAMRMAAWAALILCEVCNINVTTTKTGKYCGLGAALYGDPSAASTLQPHCRTVMKLAAQSPSIMEWRKTGKKLSLVLR